MRRIYYPARGPSGSIVERHGAQALSPDEVGMQRQLYAYDRRRAPALCDAAMGSTLGRLRAAPVLQSFRLWLVGSRLEPGKELSDIDLVLSPRGDCALSDGGIEEALWHCRHFGLYAADVPCLIDPCFRVAGPTLFRVPLQPDAVLQTSKLFSPKLARLVREGRIQQYRRFGRFSIEYMRKAEETEYYAKLPTGAFDGSRASYLRPAVELT